jgi:transforming growth factor-beta-induced protein
MPMSKRSFLGTTGLVLSAALVSACGGGDDDPDIVELAQDRGGFSALLAAAEKAGLADELADDSAALTVFAPTDAAFAALATQLGFADATAMVSALPASALASILSYHVLPSEKKAAALVAGGATQGTLYSFDGSAATVAVDATSGVKLTDGALTTATVTSADLDARNGVVHAIDKVLVPPGVLNVVQMAQVNPAFSSLVGAVTQAGLAGTLSGVGPFTVFAPVNSAFAAIAGVVGGLSNTQLQTVLTYHVVGGTVLSSAIPFGQPVATVAGQPITITAGPVPAIASITDTTATPAKVVAVDVRASNGVIHVIDKVLLPALGAD